MDLRLQAQIALHELMTAINQPSVFSSENGDEWAEIHFLLQSAFDLIEGMDDPTND